jgi:hypothetical protein
MEQTNMTDRRKFNFNLLIVGMLLIIFMMQLYNQKMLIHNSDRLLHLETTIHSYLEPPLPSFKD